MLAKQRTIDKDASVSGVGIHTGHKVNMTFRPAVAGAGIVFVRVDLPGRPSARLGEMACIHGAEAGRYSAIRAGDALIYTVEHLLSVLAGLGIDNITVELDADEAPGLDGSGLDYLKVLKSAGIRELEADKEYVEIREPICVARGGASVMIVPADDFRISYGLEYPHPMLRQTCTFSMTPEIFEKEIAPCRTFCLKEEADALRAQGLGQGADYDNTLVFGPAGVVQNVMRFPDEPARHKTLDCLGDLYLLGRPVKGHVFAFKSGHVLNRELVRKIAAQEAKYNSKRQLYKVEYKEGGEVDVRGIMGVIPHRYPFLLVDRILELEVGKRALAVKNVTMNEAFFQGHFPERPVMPGVLMLEAMAQVAAVALISTPELRGKVGFYMSVDAAKFRKVVEPGDQVMIEVEITRARSRVAQARGVCKVEGQVACEADMGFAFA
ncbi:MAG: UDP-3-O-[3-hydroxymyristoyl] N-acetylglucosamine deacetylase [Candidatus Omnitrophica bacterium]|nr:UDP-3-O-[3-hydroxymyristoyl] N-acetylglucosamine deacetylase [Candidatus Omnitrophota bacterium]